MNINFVSQSKQAAFTLVELLVTVTIIGVLATISLAVFQTYKKSAYKAELIQITRNIMGSSYIVQADQTDEFDGSVNYDGRSALLNLPGIGAIPDYIGGYSRIFSHKNANGTSSNNNEGNLSIRVCTLKAIDDAGNAATYRFRRNSFMNGDVDYQGFVHTASDGLFTKDDCESYAM